MDSYAQFGHLAAQQWPIRAMVNVLAIFSLILILRALIGHWLPAGLIVTGLMTLLGVAIFRYIRAGRLRLLGLYLIVIGASFMLIEFFAHITFGTKMFDWSLYCVIAFGALGLFLFVATLIPPLHAHLRKTFFF